VEEIWFAIKEIQITMAVRYDELLKQDPWHEEMVERNLSLILGLYPGQIQQEVQAVCLIHVIVTSLFKSENVICQLNDLLT